MVAARILMEEYDAEQDIWSDVDNIRPNVISETKKNISAESLRIMLSSFRWGGYGKPKDRVYDKLRQVAMGKLGVDNKEKARVYILRLWDVEWADPDWKDKEAKREVTTTAPGKRKPSVRVPWQLWLDELLAFVPDLHKIRANKAGTATNQRNRRTDYVPAPSVVGADVGDKRGGGGRRGDGGGDRGEQGVGENEQQSGVKDAGRESGYLEGQEGGAGQEPGGGAGEDWSRSTGSRSGRNLCALQRGCFEKHGRHLPAALGAGSYTLGQWRLASAAWWRRWPTRRPTRGLPPL